MITGMWTRNQQSDQSFSFSLRLKLNLQINYVIGVILKKLFNKTSIKNLGCVYGHTWVEEIYTRSNTADNQALEGGVELVLLACRREGGGGERERIYFLSASFLLPSHHLLNNLLTNTRRLNYCRKLMSLVSEALKWKIKTQKLLWQHHHHHHSRPLRPPPTWATMRIIKTWGPFSRGEQTLAVCLPAAFGLESHTAPEDSGVLRGGRRCSTQTLLSAGGPSVNPASRPGHLYFIHRPRWDNPAVWHGIVWSWGHVGQPPPPTWNMTYTLS